MLWGRGWLLKNMLVTSEKCKRVIIHRTAFPSNIELKATEINTPPDPGLLL
jgi:hypothetical protein